MTQVASHLFDNLKDLDAISLLHLLKVCAYSDKTMSFRPTYANLTTVEDKIMYTLPDYLKADISVAVVSFFKLDYNPIKIINELNQMFKLSIFNKD